jgi:hypothetical protein
LLWLGVMAFPVPAIADTPAEFTGMQSDVVFSDYSPRASTQSLLEWCVFDWHAERPPWMGHEAAGSTVLSRALDMLEQHAKPDSARLNQCRLRIKRPSPSRYRGASSVKKADAML